MVHKNIYEYDNPYQKCDEENCHNLAKFYIEIFSEYGDYYFCKDHHPLKNCEKVECSKCEKIVILIANELNHTFDYCNRHDHPE